MATMAGSAVVLLLSTKGDTGRESVISSCALPAAGVGPAAAAGLGVGRDGLLRSAAPTAAVIPGLGCWPPCVGCCRDDGGC
jgi:hypothetical protein